MTDTHDLKTLNAVIANGASLSGAIEAPRGYCLVGIVMPAAWTTAGLSFQAGWRDLSGTEAFVNVFNSAGTEYSIASGAAAINQFIPLDPVDFAGMRSLKIRSGTSGSATTQGAARTIATIWRLVS